LADYTDESNRGFLFGLHRALDTTGAVIGLLGVALYTHFFTGALDREIRVVILGACAAGIFSLIYLATAVKEPARHHSTNIVKPRLSVSALSGPLRKYLLVSFILSLASSSDSFIILKANEMGLGFSGIFLVLALFNLVSVGSSILFSKYSDTLGRKFLLIIGWSLYALCYVGFAKYFPDIKPFILIWIAYGLFYGITEGAEKALIADLEVSATRGQAYGWLSLVSGTGIILANLGFGVVYQTLGARTAFAGTAVLALIGVIGLTTLKPSKVINEPKRPA
jgi:MFS family permease